MMQDYEGIVQELVNVSSEGLDSALDRGLLSRTITGRMTYKPGTPPEIVQRRIDQIQQLSERVKVQFNDSMALEIIPDHRDSLIAQHLRFGSEWHDFVDIELAVLECLKD